jgi:hypothetical protein
LFVAIYIIRDRRRRHAAHFLSSLTRVSDEIGSVPPPRPSRHAIPPLFTPTYKSIPPYIRFGDDDDMPEKHTNRLRSKRRNGPPPPAPPPSQNDSISSLDIERILDSATIYQEMSDSSFRPSDVSLPRIAAPPATATTRLNPPTSQSHVSSYLSSTSLPQSIPPVLLAGGSSLGNNIDSSLSLPHGVGPERFSFVSGVSDLSVRHRPAIPPQLYTVVQEGSLASSSSSSSPTPSPLSPNPSTPTGSEQLDPSWYGIAS